MMLHERGDLRTGFPLLRLTVTYHEPCQQQERGIGKRLIDAQAGGDLDILRAHRLPVARVVGRSEDLPGAIDDLAARLP